MFIADYTPEEQDSQKKSKELHIEVDLSKLDWGLPVDHVVSNIYKEKFLSYVSVANKNKQQKDYKCISYYSRVSIFQGVMKSRK